MTETNDRKKVRIAVGGKNRGLVDNGTVTWRKLCRRLGEVTVTPEKFVEYQRGKVTWKNQLKNCAGYWIGAHCADGKRNKKSISTRDVLCFDVDNGDLYDGDLIKELQEGTSPISQYEFFVHTSRSHTFVKPRFRVVFLLANSVSANDYRPLAKFMAQKFDPSMTTVDPVSFRVAQMMYNPSCSSDVEDQFFSFRNEGEALDPYPFLESCHDDWRDFKVWPTCPGEKEERKQVDKAEWPLSKKGLVGAFCRTYDIFQAIEEFLPDVYVDLDESGSEPRYRLAEGSGGHGAVVYDDGMFLYSHHGTDEASDMNVNAFDLVRLNRFRHLDDRVRDLDTVPMRKRPSWKAMEEMCGDDAEVQRELIADFVSPEAFHSDLGDDDSVVDVRSDLDAEMDDMLGEGIHEIIPPGTERDILGQRANRGDWMKDLEVGPQGIKPTIYNASVIIGNDSRFRGCFAFNELTCNVTLVKPIAKPIKHLSALPLINKRDGDMVEDDHMNLVRAFIDSPGKPMGPGYGVKLGMADTGAAMAIVARENSFHPVRRYLKQQKWDGVPRVESLFTDYLGTPANVYTRETAKLMLVGAVTRVFEPGHKFDTAVILESPQGSRKSTMIKIMGRDRWFAELKNDDFGNQQKMVESMQGNWIIELPELKGIGKADANTVKAFISGEKEEVRMAYARTVKTFYRQCIFIGSTNDGLYLIDTTGNRRFWPIKVYKNKYDPIDTEKLDSEMDQIWAEAYVLYQEMRKEHPTGVLPLMLSREAEAIAEIEQGARVREGLEHTWGGIIETAVDKPVLRTTLGRTGMSDDLDNEDDTYVVRNVVSTQSIWTDLLGFSIDKLDNKGVANVARAMGQVDGWVRGPRIRSQYLPEGRATVWYRAEAFTDMPDHVELQDGFCTEENNDLSF